MQQVHRRRTQRGALAIEFLLVIGALLLVFLLMLQYAAQAHAHRVAQAAAEEALAATAAYDGTVASGTRVGHRYLADLGNLSHTSVTVRRGRTTAEVTVTGDADQVFPFFPVHVSVHLQGPVERFVRP